MKRTKKILSILLTLVMALAMSIPAFADDDPAGGGDTTTPVVATQEGDISGGSITINSAVEGQTYSAYQILYLESYNPTAKAYSYKANSAWEVWLKTQTTYVSIDAQGYVTWVKDADAVAFAKAAQVEAAKMTTNLTKTVEKNESSVTFSDLKLGYYLVDTSLGTLCFLDTTKPTATIEEKNSVPTIDKKVGEDSKKDTDDYWCDQNTAQIGDTVEFKTTVHAKKGAQNYVVHDQMSEGLTLNQNSIKVKVGETTLTKDTDYTVAFNVQHKNGETVESKCDFEITFKQTYLDTIIADTNIVIEYTAILNDKAAIYTDANTNKTKLDYGSNADGTPSGETTWDETETYTFKFDIVKTDSAQKLLTGAKFELYDAETGGNKIALVKESDGVYRVATTAEKDAENFTSAVIEAGKVTVKGLDANTTYWLEETEAPAGYNKLAGRVKVEIKEENLTATMTGDNDDTWLSGGAHIVNNTGTELPSTGGIGTTVFYAAGVILALGAAVVLVARRRMRTE